MRSDRIRNHYINHIYLSYHHYPFNCTYVLINADKCLKKGTVWGVKVFWNFINIRWDLTVPKYVNFWRRMRSHPQIIFAEQIFQICKFLNFIFYVFLCITCSLSSGVAGVLKGENKLAFGSIFEQRSIQMWHFVPFEGNEHRKGGTSAPFLKV